MSDPRRPPLTPTEAVDLAAVTLGVLLPHLRDQGVLAETAEELLRELQRTRAAYGPRQPCVKPQGK